MEGDFVLRYRTADTGEVDGLTGREGAFLACSFWLADCLTLLGREHDARELLERLLDLRNDLGLLSEEYDPVAGRLVGNFPQAFSHVSLVNSAAKITGHQQADRRPRVPGPGPPGHVRGRSRRDVPHAHGAGPSVRAPRADRRGCPTGRTVRRPGWRGAPGRPPSGRAGPQGDRPGRPETATVRTSTTAGRGDGRQEGRGQRRRPRLRPRRPPAKKAAGQEGPGQEGAGQEGDAGQEGGRTGPGQAGDPPRRPSSGRGDGR